MYPIRNAIATLNRVRRNLFVPKHDVDPTMRAASKGIHRFFMVRSALISENLELAKPYMSAEQLNDPYSGFERKLRSFTTLKNFWVKQCFLIASERNEEARISIGKDLVLRINTTLGSDFPALAANMRVMPHGNRSRDVIQVCNRLYPYYGYKGSQFVPNLIAQLEVIDESNREGYLLGGDGALAPIIKDYPEHHLDVLRYCIDRGVENFNADNYQEYRSVGAMREGML